MMNHPLVSLLIPLFNVEQFIERCARSLFEQTWKEIEYIFVDDHTPDQSVQIIQQILKEYPERKNKTRIIHHAENLGIAEVRNTLLNHATGDYILFADSDDWMEPNMVEELVKKAMLTNADIVGCDYYTEYKNQKSEYNHAPLYKGGNVDHIIHISQLHTSTYLWLILTKRSLYTDNQLQFISKINVCEDYIIFNKLFYFAQHVSYISKALYHYSKQNENSYSQLSMQNLTDRINSIHAVEQFLKEKGIYTSIMQAMHTRKFIAKKALVTDKRFRNLLLWKETFPECNYLCKKINLGFRNNLAMLLASHNFFTLAKIVLYK